MRAVGEASWWVVEGKCGRCVAGGGGGGGGDGDGWRWAVGGGVVLAGSERAAAAATTEMAAVAMKVPTDFALSRFASWRLGKMMSRVVCSGWIDGAGAGSGSAREYVVGGSRLVTRVCSGGGGVGG